jgi:hypothetical protein
MATPVVNKPSRIALYWLASERHPISALVAGNLQIGILAPHVSRWRLQAIEGNLNQ